MEDYIVLVIGQDNKQLDAWLRDKVNEIGVDKCLYKPKELKLHVKGGHQDTVFYCHSKTQDMQCLQGFRGQYVVFLEGEYHSSLINQAVFRCARKGLVTND